MSEIYFSVDIESNGPIPGPYSMLSFGVAAMTPEKGVIATFSRNLVELPGTSGHPDTMAWWGKEENRKAWEACRQNTIEPAVAMKEFVAWVKEVGGKPVCVAYPAGFDFTWLHWYCENFTGGDPFGFSCIDIKSFAMAMLKSDFRLTTKRAFPKRWFPANKHTHVAIDDAIEQGLLFMNMLRENRSNGTR